MVKNQPQFEKLDREEQTNLFGPGFLNKASMRIEVDRMIEKMSLNWKGKGPLNKYPTADCCASFQPS